MKRDANGRFMQEGPTPKRNRKKKQATITPINLAQLTNHVIFMIDASGSMSHLRKDVVKNYNEQLRTVKANAMRTGQRTIVSTYTFNYNSHRIVHPSAAEWVPEISEYQYSPGGGTALFDAINTAVRDFQDQPNSSSKDTSLLLIVITDGEENSSRICGNECLKSLISTTTATDRYTYTFLTPASGRHTLENFGIAPGNIQTWEATPEGYRTATQRANKGISSYYGARAMGLTSTQSFYTPDLTNVSAAAMKRKLDDASQDFLRLAVPADGRIDTFVPQTTGNPYVTGSGFYQLTKSEKIQDYKGLVIQDTRDNKLYSGITNREDLKEVRAMLGLPADTTITVRPAKHPTYNIFVQSGSRNRKLIGGTTLLLDKNKI